jgi:hypothetical protein
MHDRDVMTEGRVRPAHREESNMARRSGILGIWAVAIPVIAAGCGGNQAPANTPRANSVSLASPSTTTAEQTPTPTATPAPTPAPWKTYKSRPFKFQMRYPADWVVTPGSAKRADQIDDSSSHFVYVSRDRVTTSVDLKRTVANEKTLFKRQYKAKLLSDRKVSLARYSGRSLTFSGVNHGRKLYMQVLIIKRGAVAYFIEMFSDPGTEAADRKLFWRMYKTFRPRS